MTWTDALTMIAVLVLFAAAAYAGYWSALYDWGDRHGYRFGRWLLEKLWPTR